MKRRLVISLFVLFALFSLGTVITIAYIYNTTSNLQSVITLHRVEIIRQNLVINAQTVQTHLYTFGTVFGKEVDEIVQNVMDLDRTVSSCLGCHHDQEMTARLQELNHLVEDYKDALSYLVTISANPERIERLRRAAITIGNTFLGKAQEMAFLADQRLNERTVRALRSINNSRAILIITLVLSFFIALAIAVSMTRQITEPINELVAATRHIKAGELGYTTSYKAEGEFGELIRSFNDMSLGLKETNQKLMNHLHALANLYSISLSLHAIGSREDIFGEVSQGVAQLLDVKQCGVMLLEGEEFRHQWPAVGLSRQEAETLHVPKEKMQRCYHSTRRKALILNEGISAAPTAEAEAALKVRNLMFVWIRHRGKLVGAIRVANKNKGEFTEEDVRLMAILANNLAVALENARLYESLRERMRQLQEAQEQLVQAAKLAAIGELASNVAHEINNPLTSILGYAELIREETDLESIRRDVEIIEKESLRARDIVHQLLEFARKRPLEMAQEDVNALLQSVLELLSVQLKDTRVQVQKELQPLPPITADGNQLKQVFLNIINNALDAMQGEGVLKVRTFTASGMVCVQICDTGKGIPQEVLPRIFEPFFTTKKEKGTGLGLPISYKIVQAHKGHIDVRSETGRGSCFTVRLPMAPGGASFRTEAADSAQA